MLWFGITEHFRASVCQLAWLYGSKPKPLHFKKSREGNYTAKRIHEVLSEEDIIKFQHNERFDLALYAYAKSIFEERQALSKCPLSPKV